MDEETRKDLGAVYTPSQVARFLVKWAIRKPSDIILDAAAGEGIFILESINRLVELGASKSQICSQVIGVEYDSGTYYKMLENLAKSASCIPQKLFNADFFDATPKKDLASYSKTSFSLPLVDATVGNPPYVERQRLKQLGKIREKALGSPDERIWLSSLTDIYGYFILHLTRFLKSEGRLALIVSDTWLNMRFGEKIKEYLLSRFKIKAIVGFRERVFPEVLVRTILLLIEKGEINEIEENRTYFIELGSIVELDTLPEDFINVRDLKNGIFSLHQKELEPDEPWSIYLKAPKTYHSIVQKPLITSLSDLADSAIGIQTLAKNFYILKESELKRLDLEKACFRRIAVSPRDTPLVIENEDDVKYFILYCDKSIEELKGTALLKYIEAAEKIQITIRGKTEKVIGINNIPRLKQARRTPWYNVKANLERCDRAPILLPRRTFGNYACYWNRAKVVENENFIRIYPRQEEYTLPILAFLNSSIGEFIVRARATMYGGGVYDLRPDDVKTLRILDMSRLSNEELESLERAYMKFLTEQNKSEIDQTVFKILGMREQEIDELYKGLHYLRKLSIISKG